VVDMRRSEINWTIERGIVVEIERSKFMSRLSSTAIRGVLGNRSPPSFRSRTELWPIVRSGSFISTTHGLKHRKPQSSVNIYDPSNSRSPGNL
jgi:hypothetical protein